MPIAVAEPEVALAFALERGVVRPDVRSLVEIARTLTLVPDPSIDPGFAARLEARLLSEGTQTAPSLTEAPAAPTISLVTEPASGSELHNDAPTHQKTAAVIAFPRRRFVVRKALAVAIAAAMMLALPVAASAAALPGSPFYGLKTRLEKLQLIFARGAVADGFVLVGQSDRRLHEADQLIALGRTALVDATMNRMRSLLITGTTMILDSTSDPATLRRLASSLRQSTVMIAGMLKEAPTEVRTELLLALASGNALSTEVAQALGVPVVTVAPPKNAGPAGGPEADAAALVDANDPLGTAGGVTADPNQNQRRPDDKKRVSNQDDDFDSSATTAPCMTSMYAGPGHQETDTACVVIESSAETDGDLPEGPVSH